MGENPLIQVTVLTFVPLMNCIATRLPFRQTNAFSRIALDYIDQASGLKPFFLHTASLSGMQQAIDQRKKFNTNRSVLVAALKEQYKAVDTDEKVLRNIDSLLSENTFTITTAHQNNIFTGPLYFIYKIVHAIQLADHLNKSIPGNQFVPLYYIGSEDADLEELNHIWLGGEKLVWETKQTGSVGRMIIDDSLLALLNRMEGQLLIWPSGSEIIGLLRSAYTKGRTIAEATFHFVNSLFSEYGLVVLEPDRAALKNQMHSIFEDDLLHQGASGIVETTAASLEKAGYKVQAHPREINLFYLLDNKRERIEKSREGWKVVNNGPSFTKEALLQELNDHPERFSPNVILRGLYQETILPNIAFIGGGGETAYWLQLKDLFQHYQVPFPVLILRNSFLILEKKWMEKAARLGFTPEDLFLPAQELLNKLVKRDSPNATSLDSTLSELENLYAACSSQAKAIDSSLEAHVEALKTKTLYRLKELEKKMLRAEKRKYEDQQRQISHLREHLFAGDGLQERRDNLSYYYARWGKDFIHQLYLHSPTLEQEFVILQEQ